MSGASHEVAAAATRPTTGPSSLRLYGSLTLGLALWVAPYLVIQPAAHLLTERALRLDPATREGALRERDQGDALSVNGA